MADFSIAYNKFIKPAEGGYANVQGDKGGETYAGISRVFHPTWTGWEFIDTYKKQNGAIPNNKTFPSLADQVEGFYMDMWSTVKLSQVKNQDVANIIFDFYVNSEKTAIKKVQTLLGIPADGIVGPQTIAAINGKNADVLYNDLKILRKQFYESIVQRDPTQSKFLTGWLNRLAMFGEISLASVGLIVLLLVSFIILMFII